uniref:Secreted protein n=1 Tax=Phakopsora pachyrhizi TaxID=170000 RepID=A0A0S1MK48_PHAPC
MLAPTLCSLYLLLLTTLSLKLCFPVGSCLCVRKVLKDGLLLHLVFPLSSAFYIPTGPGAIHI